MVNKCKVKLDHDSVFNSIDIYIYTYIYVYMHMNITLVTIRKEKNYDEINIRASKIEETNLKIFSTYAQCFSCN